MSIATYLKETFGRYVKKKSPEPNVFDYMLEGIQVHDFDWRYTCVNNAYVRNSHYTREELLGYTLQEKYPGIEKTGLFQVLDRCMRERTSKHFETEFVFPDGSKTDLELSVQPVPEGLFILSIDISERKVAQEQQSKSESYYRSVIEQANDTIYIVDNAEVPKFIDINPSGCHLLGYTREEILKLNVFDIVFDNDIAYSNAKLMDLKSGKPIRTERLLKRKDGSGILAELSARKMNDGNILVVARDISERKKAEADLKKSECRFRALIENSNDMISVMDADFKVIYRSPSTARITGWTEHEMDTADRSKNLHPDDLPGSGKIIEALLANPGKHIRSSFRVLHKNGDYLWVDGIAVNLLQDENVQGILYNYRNVTDEKIAEEKIKLSELYYRSIFEQANDAIYLINPSDTSKFVDINPSGCKMLEYTKEEFLQLSLLALIEEEEVKHGPPMKEALKTGAAFKHEHGLKRKDGSVVKTESYGRMLEDGNCIVFARDITERKKAEKEIIALNENLERKVNERTLELEAIIAELKESEEKFQVAFHTSAAGISITHLDTARYVDVNNSFIEMTGFTREEILNHNAAELGMVLQISKREEILKEIRTRGFAKNFELTMRNKAGREFHIIASVETILLKGEKYALNIIYDITDRKQTEEQLAVANKELEAFSYTVSHDLRAPLRAINGYAQILLDDVGPRFTAEEKKMMQSIRSNSIKMGTMVDDLLAFSQLGRKELQKKEINLSEIVEDVITGLDRSAKKYTAITFDTPHRVKADYGLLFQVLFNLVTNGIKYSSKKEAPAVHIFSTAQHGEIIVSVKDNGAGFDMKYKDKLFGVFQRLHTNYEFEGTGVGLAIVQRIIFKHKGKVWAEGKLNEGAVFSFSLPNY